MAVLSRYFAAWHSCYCVLASPLRHFDTRTYRTLLHRYLNKNFLARYQLTAKVSKQAGKSGATVELVGRKPERRSVVVEMLRFWDHSTRVRFDMDFKALKGPKGPKEPKGPKDSKDPKGPKAKAPHKPRKRLLLQLPGAWTASQAHVSSASTSSLS